MSKTLRGLLSDLRALAVPAGGPAVVRTAAELLASTLATNAEIRVTASGEAVPGTLTLRIGPREPAEPRWMRFRLAADASGEMSASHPSYLFPLACACVEEWADAPASEFEQGRVLIPRFPWLRNLSDFLVGSLRTDRKFSREEYFGQIARLGFTHVTINGLGVPRPVEWGPPGDRYFWFYDYSPDLDQFVSSPLIAGYYPPDYVNANLEFLCENARCARLYGLVPGLHINSPRSMPEEFWSRYGFLRGARVDHPRETFRPRYTLAMAHPAVQRHYRELMRQIMRAVPDLGFVHIWTNDSGSGFEFVSSLYAGRNGGPYLIREWRDDDQIARAAARNVMTYYRLLHEEGRAVNPEFRLVCDLGPFSAERKYIIPELGDGIDAGEFAYFEAPAAEEQSLAATGARRHRKLDLMDNNVLGVPSPWLVCERLSEVAADDDVLAGVTPLSLAPFDINGEAVRFLQVSPGVAFDDYLFEIARKRAGDELAPRLVEAWRHSDRAVRAYPPGVPMSTFGFPWFRLWIRPFVPNIDAIAERERAYYEEFLLATFNNPARVDLNNDMMWNFLTVPQASEKKGRIEADVLPPIQHALAVCGEALQHPRIDRGARTLFADLRDRLLAARCYYTTMKNTLAWTESVHGFLDATAPEEKDRYRALCRAMVLSELDNTRTLLELWRKSTATFMPVAATGETLHIYGRNFGGHLERKIALMERHADDEPWIDPEFMWRMR